MEMDFLPKTSRATSWDVVDGVEQMFLLSSLKTAVGGMALNIGKEP